MSQAPPPSSPPLFSQTLCCHPSTMAADGVGVAVQGDWLSAGTHDGRRETVLRLRYTLRAPALRAIAIPEPQAAGPADGLWQHSCFEAFVAAPQQAAYHEFNFSPSGQWAHYVFSSERIRDTRVPDTAPAFNTVVQRDAQHLWLDVLLPVSTLPASASGWALGLSAVIEAQDGALSYWALQHPLARPDFHHPQGRCLQLPPPP